MSIVEDRAGIQVMASHGVVLVGISDELTAVEAPSLLDAVAEALEGGPRNLQLALGAVTFMDSGGLQALIRVRNLVRDAGVPMQLLGPTDRIHRLLEVAGLAGVFDVVESRRPPGSG